MRLRVLSRRNLGCLRRFGIPSSLGLLTVLYVVDVEAATKTVDYGWEDGAGTVVGGEVRDGGLGGQLIATNVASGMEVDYGPSDDPFLEPVEYSVDPRAGNRMLQVELEPLNLVGGPEAKAYLTYIQNLDDGDVIEYSMSAYDPSEDRSPSVTIWATYAQNGDVSTAESAPNFIAFGPFYPGVGWIDMIADQNGDVPAADPTLEFLTDGDPLRQAVVLTADLWAPSLADVGNGGNGTYSFFIDEMSITVTSENPDASITLPDGSVVMVNGPEFEADFDQDGDVDGNDFLLWQVGFGAGITSGATKMDGDFDNDGDVDGNDFLGWQVEFPSPGAGSASGAIPEPASVFLFALGCLALFAGPIRR